MSLKFEKELQRLMVSELGFEEDSWELVMAEPVAEAVGDVDNPDQIAKMIVEKAIEGLPPEIVARGKENVAIFFSQFGYDYKKEQLMAAVKKVTES